MVLWDTNKWGEDLKDKIKVKFRVSGRVKEIKIISIYGEEIANYRVNKNTKTNKIQKVEGGYEVLIDINSTPILIIANSF